MGVHAHPHAAEPTGPARATRAGQAWTGHAHGAIHERRLAIVLGLTLLYVVAEIVGSVAANSLALLADAGHLLTDAFSLTMTLVALRYARRPATPSKTYGFYRTEVLAALANGVLLLCIAAFIFFEAWHRFQTTPDVSAVPMLLVALGGLAVNLVAVRLLHGGAQESLNVRGAFLEVLGDLFGSAGTIVAAVVILLTGWVVADPLISVAVGLLILPRTWALLRSALDVLLEATPAHIPIAEVEAEMRRVHGVDSVHDLHVWTITSGFVAMSGHVQARGRSSGEVLHDLQRLLRERFGVEHATLQVEQCDHDGDTVCCGLDPRCLVVGSGLGTLADG